jgi:hypothetical protein
VLSRVILTHPNLLDHHIFLPCQFLGVKGRVLDVVCQNLQSFILVSAGDHDMIERALIAGIGIDMLP